ncbi:Glycerol uptake protein 1 [Vitis vinifera]|uniref:Glycerol uptake protein 1 n=1 Tax=Vitis vinifera TaxID=29760 RepID=A0A438I3Z2_VITVI|nr:Glycerol uptake protein 1 [Vitis vinifera]
MAEGLDKEHVLVGYDSYEEPGRRVIVYERHQSLQDWLQQHQVVIGGRLNQELISIIWDLLKAIQYLVPLRKLEGGFDMHNVVVVKGRGKITGLCDDYEGENLQDHAQTSLAFDPFFPMLLELHEDILEDELLIKVPGSAYSGEKSTTADRFGGGCLLLGLHFLERLRTEERRVAGKSQRRLAGEEAFSKAHLIKHPPSHPFSSHPFSTPLPRVHGVSRVHAILHSFTYPLKPLTQASISIQPIPILYATHNHALPNPDVSHPEFCPANVPLGRKFSLIPPGYSQPPFCPANIPLSPDVSHPEFCPANVLPYLGISHPKFFSADIPPGYSQSSFCPTNIPPSSDVSHPEFCPPNVLPYPGISHPEFFFVDIPPGYSQPPFCPANIPPSPDVSQPPFCPANILPYLDVSHPDLKVNFFPPRDLKHVHLCMAAFPKSNCVNVFSNSGNLHNPMILKCFKLDMPQNNYSVRDVSWYGSRWLFSLFLMELMTHLFYYNAFAISGLWKQLSPMDVFIIGYGIATSVGMENSKRIGDKNKNLQNFQEALRNQSQSLKFYKNLATMLFCVAYSFQIGFKLHVAKVLFDVALLSIMVTGPENMPRCINNCYNLESFWKNWHASFNKWLVRYMYIPLGGSQRKLLNIWVIFTFVACIGFDLRKLLSWAWLTCLFFVPEMILKSLANTFQAESAFGEFIFRELSAVAGAITITCLMVANLVGYVIGLSGINWFISRFLQKEGLPILGGMFITFYVGTKLMFHIDDAKKRRHQH